MRRDWAAGGTNQGQNVGWRFDVLTNLTATGLGWFDDNHDRLGAAHQVGIWDSAGSLLASTLVPDGTAAALEVQYRMVSIAALVLPAAAGYVVGA